MFDQAQRSLWLEDQLWPKLRDAFPVIKGMPAEVLITVGYPSSGARGRSEKIKPCEVNTQWTGNENEKAFLSVHPVYFDSPRNVAKALLFGAAKYRLGARWGAQHVGLSKEDDGTLTEQPGTAKKLDEVLADVGEPPKGFGVAFPVREVQRARLRKYVPATTHCTKVDTVKGEYVKHAILRAASDSGNFVCGDCQTVYTLEQ